MLRRFWAPGQLEPGQFSTTNPLVGMTAACQPLSPSIEASRAKFAIEVPAGASNIQPPSAPAGVVNAPPTLRTTSSGHDGYIVRYGPLLPYGRQSPQVPDTVYVPALATAGTSNTTPSAN